MSFEERGAWSAVLSGIIVFFIWGRPIWNATATGEYDRADGLSVWAWDVIALIGGGVILAIAMLILFNIAYAIVSGDRSLQFTSDERDKRINTRGSLVSLVVISCAFLVAIGLLAFGWGALAALNSILIGMAVAGMCSEICRIFLYRRGL